MNKKLNRSISFFFNDTATTEIYTLSLHDALPIFATPAPQVLALMLGKTYTLPHGALDRKSTRLNSSHLGISYAVFCLKKAPKAARWEGFRLIYGERPSSPASGRTA